MFFISFLIRFKNNSQKYTFFILLHIYRNSSFSKQQQKEAVRLSWGIPRNAEALLTTAIGRGIPRNAGAFRGMVHRKRGEKNGPRIFPGTVLYNVRFATYYLRYTTSQIANRKSYIANRS